MNLIANAIDAVDERRREAIASFSENYQPQITITTEQIDRSIIIRIRDNGYGMSETVQARLFNPFFTTKPAGKGTGLGLSISHQIIHDKHKGSLSCQSQIGTGTEFTIQIPA